MPDGPEPNRTPVRIIIPFALLWALAGLGAPRASAHGFAGERFFPPTLQTDDPFAADELALPTISFFKTGPETRETDINYDFSKLIVPRFGLEVSQDFIEQQPEGAPSVGGFDDLSIGAKYEIAISAAHEAIVSAGAEWDIGGTGAKRLGADSTSTVTPTLYFGKGFGDLPGALTFLRPLAVTGLLGVTAPARGGPTEDLPWGFAIEYSLPYLQSFVKDVGLRAPLKNLIPVVEFAFDTPLHQDGAATTGTINPGVLWEARTVQIGAEAIIPANRQSGSGVGLVFQVHFFIDDLLPGVFGHPIWGKG
ncbi:MAG: hypothetical protein ACREFX_06350 [Opitutaceae bacterium]